LYRRSVNWQHENLPIVKFLALFSFTCLTTNELNRETIYEKNTHPGCTIDHGIARIVCAESQLPRLWKRSKTCIGTGSGLIPKK